MWEDYTAARELCTYDDVLIVGKVGEDFPDPVDHWVSFHCNLFDKWARTRATRGYPAAANYWGAIYRGRPPKRLPERIGPNQVQLVECNGGSSGLVAVMVAIKKLEADCTVLAGVPMVSSFGHYDEPQAKSWREADNYWGTWMENMELLRDRVRSMSGRTREVLGEPTKEWLGVEGS